MAPAPARSVAQLSPVRTPRGSGPHHRAALRVVGDGAREPAWPADTTHVTGARTRRRGLASCGQRGQRLGVGARILPGVLRREWTGVPRRLRSTQPRGAAREARADAGRRKGDCRHPRLCLQGETGRRRCRKGAKRARGWPSTGQGTSGRPWRRQAVEEGLWLTQRVEEFVVLEAGAPSYRTRYQVNAPGHRAAAGAARDSSWSSWMGEMCPCCGCTMRWPETRPGGVVRGR